MWSDLFTNVVEPHFSDYPENQAELVFKKGMILGKRFIYTFIERKVTHTKMILIGNGLLSL